jgi:hypothetical protein
MRLDFCAACGASNDLEQHLLAPLGLAASAVTAAARCSAIVRPVAVAT